ncbi:Crp/Fnr family transcriptional regulator [Bacillus andreraoultii]|uniref:Crp/Fnr family transcriptional regulator n=1 Tax=Bacillus andreraoultii TaxID=1499685 RepID=UPI0005397A9A|nr:Crp/Fnr family transcriptional regulator [Bacillus andreraoultii]
MVHNHNEHQHSHTDCLRLVPIFTHLEEVQIDKIATFVNNISLQKGDFLFQPGECDNTLYIIISGKVRIFQKMKSGEEQIIRILNPGDFTGEFSIFQTKDVYVHYAEVIQNASVCLLSGPELQRYIVESPRISLSIISELSKGLKELQKHVVLENTETRVISFLVDCVERDSGNSPTINLPMSKKEIASYLGIAPETLSRKLTKLEKQGLIEQQLKRNIKIPDLDNLILHMN